MSSDCILVVDDEEDIRNLVATSLRRAGFTVATAADGAAGVEAFFEHDPRLVVLDVSMPQLDGWAVLERIREASDVPVIMLTARTAETDRVRGLRSGADDYLIKPFGRQELVARIEALLRRARTERPPAEQVLTDEFVTVDLRQRIATVRGLEVSLTPLEFRLLAVLLRHRGEVLTRERLLELVWGDTQALAPEQVKLYVSYLRRKLTIDDQAPPIETVRGAGYRWTAPG